MTPGEVVEFIGWVRAKTPPAEWPELWAQLIALLGQRSFGGDLRRAAEVFLDAERLLDATAGPGPEGLLQ